MRKGVIVVVYVFLILILLYFIKDNMDYKYKITLISMFKNESMIMDEWIQHNISEGIQHFYLIDKMVVLIIT